MGADLNFDASGVKPNEKPDPVPAGDYRVAIVESEVKPTKNGGGKMLVLKMIIVDGLHRGRSLWDRLNIVNPSAEARAIAQGQLSAICHAAGVLQLKNSSQLHNIPMMAKVTIKQSTGYDPTNEVKRYTAIEGTTPITAAPSAAPSAATPTANAPAWAKKAG